MGKLNLRRIMAILAAICLCNVLLFVEVLAAPISDTSGHWQEDAFEAKRPYGIVYDDEIRGYEQKRFEDYLWELFEREIARNTINLHYTLKDPEAYGIDRSQVTLGTSPTESFEEEGNAILNELRSIDKDLLTPEQQREYDAVYGIIDSMIFDDEFMFYENFLSPDTGYSSQLPVLLAAYKFYNRQDIDDYLLLLKDLPRVFGDIGVYLRRQSADGLFMNSITAEEVIAGLDIFLDSEGSILVTSFDERIDKFSGLSQAEKERLKADNMAAVRDCAVPAYEMIWGVMEELKDTGVNDGGLSGLPNGKLFYEKLVRQNTGLTESVSEIKAGLEKAIADGDERFEQLIDEDPGLLDRYYNLQYEDAGPEAMVLDLREKSKADFPELPELSYKVESVPESMKFAGSPAFYLTTPIDGEEDENVIYVNYALLDDSTIYHTLAHEGYPGHLYQTNYASQGKASILRLGALPVNGYSEGWATYVERHSYGYRSILEDNPNLAEIIRINDTVTLSLYGLLDIGIHYEGWTLEDVIQKLEPYGTDAETSEIIYNMLAATPVNYLCYAAPSLKIEELRAKAENALGDNFDLKEFHTVFLDAGPCMFDFAERMVDEYIAENMPDNQDNLPDAA